MYLLRYSPLKHSDECNFTPAMDHVMEDLYYPFRPHFNLLLLDEPLKLSRNASMTDSVIASASEWLTQSRMDAERNTKGL